MNINRTFWWCIIKIVHTITNEPKLRTLYTVQVNTNTIACVHQQFNNQQSAE